MFTGIVEETGRVVEFIPPASVSGPGAVTQSGSAPPSQGGKAWRLCVAAKRVLDGTLPGDSIAVDGCCLTAVELDENRLTFDVLEETRRLTHFSGLRPGSAVNLERSLRFDGKVGGHFVTGHIDGLGKIKVLEQRGNDTYLGVQAPPGSGRYLVPKGSIAIDGISLTVAEVDGDWFAVWLIPHTLEVTNLRDYRAGGAVNLEFDLLGKYVEKLLPGKRA